MNTEKVLESFVKGLDDEEAKEVFTGLLRSIGYFYFTSRTFRKAHEVIDKARRGDDLENKDYRKLVRVFGWLTWYVAASWETGRRETEKFHKATEALIARMNGNQRKARDEREVAQEISDRLKAAEAARRRASQN